MSVNDEDRLAELGYKQELTRNWSLLHNFGISFSIIVSRNCSSPCIEVALVWVEVTVTKREVSACPIPKEISTRDED